MRNFIMIILGVMATLLLAQQGSTEPMPNVTFTTPASVVRVDEALINKISTLSKAPREFVIEVVDRAEELSYKDFPSKNDILSVIAVESMFRNNVTDGMGSCGLMQVNAKANKLDPTITCTLPMTNMTYGVKILRDYYERLGSTRGALLAYNAGVGNFLEGNYDERYHKKFLKWKEKLHVL